MNTEFHTLFEWFMQMYIIYKTWMMTHDIPNEKSYLFMTTQLSRVGFSPNADKQLYFK